MLLKNYLDERVRQYREGKLIVPTSPEGKTALEIWNVLRSALITNLEKSNMSGPITVKLVAMPQWNFYYSDGEFYKQPNYMRIPFREQILKIILKLAADEGILVNRKENETITFFNGNHIHIYKDKVVYEFTYIPPSV